MRCTSCGHDNREGARFCEECGGPLVTAAIAAPATVGAGRYRLGELLGEGARKRVYHGRDERLEREVAVAVVKTEGLDDAGRHRIEREARAMARLGDHPNIVTVFDVGEDQDQPFIVSQLMPGGSVADRIAAERLPLDEAVRIAEQVARGLDHAHALGIVHRDLKPANVWFASDGSALLGDFGLAVDVGRSRMTSEGMVVGTVAYLAPEQAVGRAPDARSDLYALGAMTYELLTGRPPFLGDDAVGVISQHLNTAPVAPSWHNASVPPALEALVLALLEKDPTARPATARSVVDALAQLDVNPVEPFAPAPTEGGAPRGALVPFGRFVGRAEERAQLEGAFDEAVSGRGRLLMVVGEPGIGKTRLTEELATYAGVRGAQVCWGHCYEGELGVPYLPFVEALRAYTRARPDDELRTELSTGAPEVATLVSELRQRFPDLPEAPALEGDAERLRLFEGVTTFLHHAAASQPLVLLLDDLHWADKPTLLLLQYLARNLRRDRVLMVGTYRDIELDRAHPLADAVAALRRERLFDRVLLRGLPPEDVKAFLHAVGEQEPSAEFAATIHRETEGNPFFMAEILRHLAETGAIARVDGRWVGDPESVAENLPEGVREVIGRRLDRLSADCNRMLTVGAAMPGGFELEVAGSVLDLDEDRVLDVLDEALDRQIVRERRETVGTFEFTHALIRQTLYGELSTPRRVRLHRQIAAALEVRYDGNVEAHLGELAYHCFQAAPGGDVDRAVDYSVRAGGRAESQAAHEEAARFYDMSLQALDLVDAPDPRERAELLLVLGEAQNRAGETDASQAVLAEAAEIARGLDDGVLFGRIARAAASLRWYGTRQPELAALLDEALGRLGDEHDVLRAQLLARRAELVVFFDVGEFERFADEAVVVARRSGDPGALAHALNTWTMTLRQIGDQDRWRDAVTEAARLASEAGDVDRGISIAGNRVIRAAVSTDRAEFDEQVERYAALAAESRSPWQLSNAMHVYGMVAAVDGALEEAERRAFEVLGAARRLREPGMLNNVGVLLYPIRREQGRLAELEEPTRRVVGGPDTMAAWRIGLAHLLTETGQESEAAEILDAVARDGFGPDNVARPYTLCAAAEVAARVGRIAHAQALRQELGERSGTAALLGTAAYHGAVDRYLGLVDLLLGDHDEAVGHLEAALALHERFRARPWAARTRYDLGRAFLARDADGDRARVLPLLNDALDAAGEIGMPRLVEEVLAVKLDLQGAGSTSITASIDIVAAGVSIERPDLRHHAAADGRVTIVFSDIEGYTELTERLGDARSQEIVRAHNAIVRREVAAHRGSEVKSAGDGFMLAFGAPDDALRCSVAIQQAITAHDVAGERIKVRIGLHVGEVIREDDDLFGRTVIRASRVATVAIGGEVLVTEEVRAAVKEHAIAFDAGREVELKGLRGPQRVFGVSW